VYYKKTKLIFYIESHRSSHNIIYDTIRINLLKLVDLGFLNMSKIEKNFLMQLKS